MRQLNITLIGTTPYLMNNPASMRSGGGGTKRIIPTPEAEALSKCYWNEEHTSLVVPATHVHACLIRASGRYKVDKQYLSSILIGACHIEPELIPLNTTEYQLDTRSAVVQKQRIFRTRPKVRYPWKIEFEFHFDPDWLPLAVVQKTLPEIFKTAGKIIGIGDYRTEKKGPFGHFYLKRLELMPQREEEEVPEPEIMGFDNITVFPEPEPAKKSAKKKA